MLSSTGTLPVRFSHVQRIDSVNVDCKKRTGRVPVLLEPGKGRGAMKNLNFLTAAYIAIWLIFCGYVMSVARRMANLKDDIHRLKQDGK